MRNTVLRILWGIAVFVVAVLLMELPMNQSAAGTTGEMAGASFPLVTMRAGAIPINELSGLTAPRTTAGYRPVITPVPGDRTVRFSVDLYGAELGELSYEVQSVDGGRLIAQDEITDVATAADGTADASFTLNPLIEKNTEYMLFIRLKTEGREAPLYFCTRILCSDDASIMQRILFARDLHAMTLRSGAAPDLAVYLEPDGEPDPSDLSHVTIRNTPETVTWNGLSPEEKLLPVIAVTDLQGGTASFRLDYVVGIDDPEAAEERTGASAPAGAAAGPAGAAVGMGSSGARGSGAAQGADRAEKWFDCSEYMLIQAGTERCYLLDYDREVREIFDPSDPGSFEDGTLLLGITRLDQYVRSEGGGAAAFVNGGRLYSCCGADSAAAFIFGFADTDSLDRRTAVRDNGIRILSVDEAGGVDFLVYGYMPRGSHEGGVGTAVYSYNSVYRTIEEKAYIPYPGSAELLKSQVLTAACLGSGGDLFLMMDGILYRTDLSHRTMRPVAAGLREGESAVSESGRMFAYYGDDEHRTAVLTDLSDMTEHTIEAPEGEETVLLGFLGEDLVCGFAARSDMRSDMLGSSITPMHLVRIIGGDNGIRSEYEVPGYDVVSAEISEGRIVLHRIMLTEDGGIVPAPDDQILATGSSAAAGAPSYASQAPWGRTARISVRGLKQASVRLVRPKEVVLEEPRTVSLAGGSAAGAEDSGADDTGTYFVHDLYGSGGICATPTAAIRSASERRGIVTDESGRCIWRWGGRPLREQIMSIRALEDRGETPLERCLNTIFVLEGADADAAGAAARGLDGADMLLEGLPDAVPLDLTGCTLDEVLYYASREIPVVALTEDGGAVLLTGYNEQAVVVVSADLGLQLVPKQEAEDAFARSGSRYMSYLR